MNTGLRVSIEDDFDLPKIAVCGQCFRAVQMDEGTWRFITGEQVLYIAPLGGEQYRISCSLEEWERVWKSYFHLDYSYRRLRASIPCEDAFLCRAAEAGQGIRILRQDPWETLLTFILSQRKSIPAIRQAVENLCTRYGKKIAAGREELYCFPTPKELQNATPEELNACKLGYRTPYVLNAIQKLQGEPNFLRRIEALGDEELLAALMSIKGVGIKVASCVALFAYGRFGLAPVDTWMLKIIEREYGGVNRIAAYGQTAGLMQQYAFLYALQHKEEYR